ncbi:MAG: DUF58 domain-containing protein [Austwickia sp.]|nr:DUF58 domain-containing protein [Austwickia sp.]
MSSVARQPRLSAIRPDLTRIRAATVRLGSAVARTSTRARTAATRGPFTTLGAGTTALALIALTLGLWQGWVELTALALVLLTVLIAAFAWTLRRAAFAAHIDLDTHRIPVGDEVLGRVVVRNRGARLAVPDRIELPVGASRDWYPLPLLARGAEHEQAFAVPGRRRAVVAVGPVRSRRGDPLGLLRRTQRWTDAETIYVHPRTVHVDLGTAGLLRDIDGIATRDLSSSDVSFHALREYQPGDDRRAVHWLTTARTGRLMIRQFEEARRSHLLLLLSLRAADYASADDFETAVSVVGSCGGAALRQGRQLTVMAGPRVLPAPTAPLLLDRLAELGLDPAAAPLAEAVAAAARHAAAASAVILVTGSGIAPAELAVADARLPLGMAGSALLCDARRPLGRRSVGRLGVVDLPTLDDLPRVLRGLA